MTLYHPQLNDHGQSVPLKNPSKPTSLSAWSAPSQRASVVPSGPMPDSVCCVAVTAWHDAPVEAPGWEELATRSAFDEPDFKAKSGKKAASGVVVVESDGRVWVVSPSNQYGGYVNTFPKGTIETQEPLSLKANALKEAYEEAGLRVELVDFLVDSDRTTTTTRYYLGRRIGGNPSSMGWESQCVHLVPQDELLGFVTHPNDAIVLKALKNKLSLFAPASGHTVKREESPVRLQVLSEISAQFSIRGSFSDSEMTKIRRGFQPASDDDKWFIFCESDRCYFHRASDGFLLFVVDFSRTGNEPERPWVIEKCIVSLGALQDQIPSEPLLLQLIDYHLLGKF